LLKLRLATAYNWVNLSATFRGAPSATYRQLALFSVFTMTT
jgi:hypothetical protein